MHAIQKGTGNSKPETKAGLEIRKLSSIQTKKRRIS